jgi:hypothetical protein
MRLDLLRLLYGFIPDLLPSTKRNIMEGVFSSTDF